jgi:hypothetical protein
MSMSWARSFCQSTSFPKAVASFALLRPAATSFYAAESLSRRISQVLGVLLLLLVSVTSTVTFAEEPSPVQKAAENYYPKLVKKFPTNRTSPCKACKKEQEDLNVAWAELSEFDGGHPTVRAVYKAWNEETAAKDALAAARKAGVGVKEAQDAVDKAAKNSKDVQEKQEVEKKPFQDAAAELEKIYQKIKKAADALELCEKNCPKDEPAAGLTFKPIPNCFDEKYIDDLDAQLVKLNAQLGGKAGLRATLDGIDEKESPAEYTKVKAELEKAEADKKAVQEQKKKAYEKWKMKCPDDSGMYFPGWSKDDQTNAVTFVDTGKDCTFGRSEPISTPLTPTDVNFNPIPDDGRPQGSTPTDIPETPRTAAPGSSPPAEKPPVSDTPKTPTDTPKTPTDRPRTPTASDTPRDQPQAPEQPTTTAKPPETPTTTTDAPPTDDVVILFKGNQAVLELRQTGDPLQGQHIMLVFKKPEPRESGTGKPATDDSGFDKDGVHGVTGPDGQTKLTVPAEDRELYLSNFDGTPKKYYRVDANVMKNTGGVREIARNAKPDLTSGAPQGGKVNAEIFKIGDRTFVRRLYVAPYGVAVVLIVGDEVDWCRVILPGPALGMEPEYPSALHRELPEATVNLPQAGRRGRYSR